MSGSSAMTVTRTVRVLERQAKFSTPCQNGPVNQQSIGAPLFHGTTGLLRPGDKLPPDSTCSNDPAEALAHAWRAASAGTETPYVYEVGMSEGRELTVVRDLLIDGSLAGRALDIAAQNRSSQ